MSGPIKINFRHFPGTGNREAEPVTLGPLAFPWAHGTVNTPVGEVPRVATALLFSDRLGSWKARWGIARMHYLVKPGLYAVGDPTPESPVLVSANYKKSFDTLRSELGGIDAWLMVLDTRGINVWCAAGKGTFGTDEIVQRIRATGLERIVSHKRLVVPQLGAPGVSAHEVRKQSGFRVVYGPVRANDIRAFLTSGMKCTPEMRRIRFTVRDRAVLIPLEIIMWAKIALPVAAVFFLLAGIGPEGYTFENLKTAGSASAALFLGAYLWGAILGPILLPWLPGRAFSVKGMWVGLLMVLFMAASGLFASGLTGSWLSSASWALLIPAVASFMVMNFTGASTYTSLSGVRREMRTAVPAQITGAVLGLGLWIGGLFI